MGTLKKYDLLGKDQGEVQFDDSLLFSEVNAQMIKDYLVAIRANRRQWSASTQTRAEVSHSKKKPFAQKGTGNARQGFLGSPQFRGGGRVHAPRPKFDQHTRINKKERRKAIGGLLSALIRADHARILDYKALQSPQTKTLAQFLSSLDLKDKRVLFLAEKDGADYATLSRSLRNLPKVQFTYLPNVNGYDLALCQEVVILNSALDELKETLGGSKK